MGKKYNDVKELIKSLPTNDEFKQEALDVIEEKKLSKLLFLMRCVNGLTQAEMAKKIGCSQGKVSKIESSFDRRLTIEELLEHADALGFVLEIGYQKKDWKITDQIKHYAQKIHECLERLRGLSSDDDESITNGILGFHEEAMANFTRLFSESLNQMQLKKDKRKHGDIIVDTSSLKSSPPTVRSEGCSTIAGHSSLPTKAVDVRSVNRARRAKKASGVKR